MNSLRYFRSTSVQLSLAIGLVMYLSYAAAHHAFGNSVLISICTFVSFFIPLYSKLSNQIEEKINDKTALITLGRLGRFTAQLVFNLVVFFALVNGGVFSGEKIHQLGGILGVALLTTASSQGMQYVAIIFANREIGDKNMNLLLALSVNILITAVATLGIPWIKTVFVVIGLVLGIALLTVGVLSDVRGRFPKKGGVGVFFGTFNPIHRTHLTLIRDAIESRGLDKVYLHSTTVPKLHADALNSGAIFIARREAGMRVYERTALADVHTNYFPTGNKFYEYETRLTMMRLAIKETGLEDKVEVLSMPRAYSERGFYSVLSQVKQLAKGRAVHGIHGSDLGGMWVRGIYDECGWIYPYSVVRRDKVSATAIRNGAKGFTTDLVEKIIAQLSAGAQIFTIGSQTFNVQDGRLIATSY